ncbi:MAG TPA: PAS domain S-box protein [Verrucomicrobiae bacterium]|nr:PAS domain S-box protein [Verrucomicrobiae bacterium]
MSVIQNTHLKPVVDVDQRCDGNHFVQFYESEEFLVDSVAAFIGSGLGAGEGGVVIATSSHLVAIGHKLAAQGVDLAVVEARGQYVALDAAEALSKFMVDGCPEPSRFEAYIGHKIENAARGRRGVRAFGEMVSLLWADGNGDAVLSLEELWNKLAEKHTFTLFCAYPITGFSDTKHSRVFSRICQAHSHVKPLESLDKAPTAAEQSRLIAEIQQRALSLEKEIVERERAEETLRRREAELTQFVEHASVGLHWVGPDGIIQWANKADFEFLGFSGDDYIGHHIAEFHADRHVIDDILSRLSSGERLQNYEARLKCKDGSFKTVLIDSCVLWEGGKFIHTQCFTRDITDQKRAEDELRQTQRQLEADADALSKLNHLGSRLWKISSLQEGIDEMLNATIELLEADMGNIQLLDGPRLRIAAQRGFSREFLDFFSEVSVGDASACGRALRTGDRIIIPDVQVDKAYAPMRAIAESAGYRAVQSTPLIGRNGKPRGMISTHWHSPHCPNERQLRHLELYVRQATDFIERCEIEDVLRESEKRLRNIFNQSTVGLAQVDVDGRFILVNQRFCDILGYSAGELRNETCSDLMFFSDQALKFDKALHEGNSILIENRYARRDGSNVWVRNSVSPMTDADGGARQMLIVSVDITEEKRAQEGASRLAAIIEHSEDAIFSTDTEGVINSWNRGAERLYGYLAIEIVGRPIFTLIPPGRANEEPEILRRICRNETVENYETQRLRKDGAIIDVSLTVSPIKDSSGKVIGVSKVARDITEKVRSREILEQTVAERTASLREVVAQMEEFSYSVSHDLRAPLRAISGYADVLLEDPDGQIDETTRAYLGKIRRCSDRMNRLTLEVLTYSRVARSQIQLENVNLDRLVRDVMDQYSNVQGPALEVEILGELPLVCANETMLAQVVSNLLNNAVKFVSPSTKPRVLVRAEHFSKQVRVWFEDNGIGIRLKDQERIFGMFERLHPEGKFEGTGIGLAIVRKAMEKMGGKVGVESDGENGSRFWIELPAPNQIPARQGH